MRHHGVYKKPLLGKVIYIDLAGNVQGLQTLQEKLQLLGAELESCFSKEVDYLITNKEYAKPANLGTSPSNTSPGGTPSPFGLAKGSVASPRDHSVAGETRASSERLSRGQKLLNARRKKTYAGIVENAVKWKVKIISYENALKYIERELKNMPESVKHAAASKSKTYEKKKKRMNLLKGPFLKFEAASRHYRPVYQEFTEIPQLHLNSRLCPFDKNKVSQGTGVQQLTQEEMERAERGNEREMGTPGESGNSKASEPKQLNRGKKPVRKKSGEAAIHSATKIYTPGELRNIMREKARVEAKKGYCEICRLPYDDIKKHQLNVQHRDFVRNADNFSGLDNMIESGPNFDQFLSDVIKFHEEHVKEGLAESEMDDEVLLIKEGLPGSSDQELEAEPSVKRTSVAGGKKTPKKRLFSGLDEGPQTSTAVGSRKPEKVLPIRRKVVAKRVLTSSHSNKCGPKDSTVDRKDSSANGQSKCLGLSNTSACIPDNNKSVSRLPKVSPRQQSLRSPRQSLRIGVQRRVAPVVSNSPGKSHNKESGTMKRKKLSLRDAREHAVIVESCDNVNGLTTTQGCGNVRASEKVEATRVGDGCCITLRDIVKGPNVVVENVVNTLHIVGRSGVEPSCTASNTNLHDTNCDITQTDKAGRGMDDVTDKCVRNPPRRSRRDDITPSVTDFQDSGINVSNSSPVKEPPPHKEGGRLPTTGSCHRKSSRKTRSRTRCETTSTEQLVEAVRAVSNREEEGNVNTFQKGRGNDTKGITDTDSGKRRKYGPGFSAKRRLIVSSDSEREVSGTEKRSRKDEKRHRSQEKEDRCELEKNSAKGIVGNIEHNENDKEVVVQKCSNSKTSPRKLASKNRTPRKLKVLETGAGTDETAKQVNINIDGRQNKLQRNTLGSNQKQSMALEHMGVQNTRSEEEAGGFAENVKNVVEESPSSKVVQNYQTVTEASEQQKVTFHKNTKKTLSACVEDNNNVQTKRRKCDGPNSRCENKIGEVKKTDHGAASPSKKGVRLSEQVASKGKLKDRSPEEREAQKKKKRIKKKLRESWQVLSDRSMRRVLESEGEAEFEGYTAESFHKPDLPVDVSYIDLTEVEYSDNSEVDWIFGEAEESWSPQHLPPIHNFLKKNDVSADGASSKWNEPVDCYVKSLQTRRVTRNSVQGTPVKKDVKEVSPLDTKLAERTMEKSVIEESKGNPKSMLKRVFSRYLSGGSLETLWVDSSEPSENEGHSPGEMVPAAPGRKLVVPTVAENRDRTEETIQWPSCRTSKHLMSSPLRISNKGLSSDNHHRKNLTSGVKQTEASANLDLTASLIVNTSQCESTVDALSPEIQFIRRDISNLATGEDGNNHLHLLDALSPEIPYVGKEGKAGVLGRTVGGRVGTLGGVQRLIDMQEMEFGGVMHSTPLRRKVTDTGSASALKTSTADLAKTRQGFQEVSTESGFPQRQISIAISNTTVDIHPTRFLPRRSLTGVFDRASSPKNKKGPCSVTSVQTAESGSLWKVTNEMDGQVEVDDNIIFNYNSPQKLSRDFSPLKDRDVAYLRRLHSSFNTTSEDPEHSRGNVAVRNLSGVLLSQAGLQIETILSRSRNISQQEENESDKSVEIPYVGGHKKLLKSPVVEEIKSRAMYKFDYMTSAKKHKARESQRRWYSERVNRSRKVLSASAKNKENCTPPSPEPRNLSRVRGPTEGSGKSSENQSERRKKPPRQEKKRKRHQDETNNSVVSAKSGSEYRVNIMLKKLRKRGCLCHEHKAGSKCPNVSECKKLPSSPDYRRNNSVKTAMTKKSPVKRVVSSRSPGRRSFTRPGEYVTAAIVPETTGSKEMRSPRKSENNRTAKSVRHTHGIVDLPASPRGGNKRSRSSSPRKMTPLKERSTSSAVVINRPKTVSPTRRQLAIGRSALVSKRNRSDSAGKSPPRKKTRGSEEAENGTRETTCYIRRRLSLNKNSPSTLSSTSVLVKQARLRSGTPGSASLKLNVDSSPKRKKKQPFKDSGRISPNKAKCRNSGTPEFRASPRRLDVNTLRLQNSTSKLSQELKNSTGKLSQELKSQSKTQCANYMLQRLNLQLSDAEVCASFMPVKTRSLSSISSEEKPAQRLSDFLHQGRDNVIATLTSSEGNQQGPISSNSNTAVPRIRKNSPTKVTLGNASITDCPRRTRSGEGLFKSDRGELWKETRPHDSSKLSASKCGGLSSRKTSLFSQSSLKGRLRNKVTVTLKPLSPTVATRLQTQGHIVT